jgi:alpha-galactosidase
MAPPAQIQEMQDWVSAAFTGHKPPGREPAVRVEVLRQEHSVLHFGQSCIDTPIKLGTREFKHGLGTHANSEIALHLPADATEFRSFVGIDDNPDTGGVRGSVQFSVEVAGREIFRTPTLRGTNQPVEVKLPLPAGTRQITLKVDTTPDGPAYDQADWADACILKANGEVCWADEDRQPFIAAGTPFSFTLAGAASASFLKNWKPETKTRETPSRRIYEVTWVDPKTALQVTTTATCFKRYPAAEWVLELQNNGSEDSQLIENIQALDVRLRTGYAHKPVHVHQLAGDVCGERSFLPVETELEAGHPLALAPAGGRPSNGAFPFFNLQYGEDEGLITAIGWSGQWRATLERAGTGPTALRADIEKTSLRLHPGEKIRTSRILVMPWKGERIAGHNRFRRLMLFEYSPRTKGHPVRMPIALQCYDRYAGARPDWGTEAVQLQAARAARDIGCDTHWLDAAWFEGGFPDGVGNWYCPAERFPNGLKPISDACHQMGIRFMVWFEPERVGSASQVAREHPQFVFGGKKGGLFKLSDPEARRWMTDLLSQRISEFGLDTYRNDFNVAPLDFWRQADPVGRQGMTEIRYVEGHYALWDALLSSHPGLVIDNCASGGRRLDIETCSRALPHWRSDTGCSPGHPDWNQTQTYGLSLYLPLFGACSWVPDAYEMRSAATAGAICQFAFLDSKFSIQNARAAIAEVKENQKFWYGDFYPLSPCTLGPGALIAYQFHRSDLNAGIVLAFRRSECPYPVLQTALRGLAPKTSYQVEFIDEARTKQEQVVTGEELTSNFEVRLRKRATSLLVRYKPLSR